MEGSEKIAVVEVRRPETGSSQCCIMRIKGFSAEDEFDGAEEGEVVTLTYRKMTQEQIDALPEFSGW